MKGLWLIPIGFVALAVPAAVLAGGDEGGFDRVVHSIESRYQLRATRVPFLGLISLISKKATHGGVGGLHVAEFESFSEPVDGGELHRIVEDKLGPGWERLVRETSRTGHEQTLVFTRPEGDRIGVFVVDLDGNEMDVVQATIDPKHLDEDIGQHKHHRRDSDKESNPGNGQPD